MAYRIPGEQQVADAIANVMVRQPHIRSQKEFVMLVSTELMCIDQDYRISAARMRRIGIKRRLITVSISYAHDERGLSGYICPVCSEELSSVMNRTLDGGSIEMKRICRHCGYKADPGSSRPCRYVIDRRTKRWTASRS